MLLVNIQSIKFMLDALLYHITLNDIDICFIAETWINTDRDLQILEANISGLGYKIINKCRENQSGGGVACIYIGHLDIQTCTKDSTYMSLECLTIKLMVKSELNWISIIYRPPYSNRHPIQTCTFIDEFPDHLSHLLCQTDNPIIAGYINIPWNKLDNLDSISLYEILELYNLEQYVSAPTHKWGNTIDQLMSIKNSEEFLDLHTSESLSDHCTIEWLFNIKRPNTVKTRSVVRNLKKINWEEFARKLNLEINKNIHDGQSLQELYDGFISSIKTTLDMHAPKKEFDVNFSFCWFNLVVGW